MATPNPFLPNIHGFGGFGQTVAPMAAPKFEQPKPLFGKQSMEDLLKLVQQIKAGMPEHNLTDAERITSGSEQMAQAMEKGTFTKPLRQETGGFTGTPILPPEQQQQSLLGPMNTGFTGEIIDIPEEIEAPRVPTTPVVNGNVDRTPYIPPQQLSPAEAERQERLRPGASLRQMNSAQIADSPVEAAEQAPPAEEVADASAKAENRSSIRGLRNNNPGNIRYKQPIYGAKDVDEKNFLVFDKPEDGVRAMDTQLTRYWSGATTGRPLQTVKDMVAVWAPPSDNNPTEKYVNFVASKMGVDPNDVIDIRDPVVKANMIHAMITMENGPNHGYSKAKIYEALTNRG